MNSTQDELDKKLDEILAFGYKDPDFINDIHVLVGGKEKVAKAKAALRTLLIEAEKKAQLGMIEYYDQVPSNKDMDWKGLFAENRAAVQFELQALKDNLSKGRE